MHPKGLYNRIIIFSLGLILQPILLLADSEAEQAPCEQIQKLSQCDNPTNDKYNNLKQNQKSILEICLKGIIEAQRAEQERAGFASEAQAKSAPLLNSLSGSVANAQDALKKSCQENLGVADIEKQHASNVKSLIERLESQKEQIKTAQDIVKQNRSVVCKHKQQVRGGSILVRDRNQVNQVKQDANNWLKELLKSEIAVVKRIQDLSQKYEGIKTNAFVLNMNAAEACSNATNLVNIANETSKNNQKTPPPLPKQRPENLDKTEQIAAEKLGDFDSIPFDQSSASPIDNTRPALADSVFEDTSVVDNGRPTQALTGLDLEPGAFTAEQIAEFQGASAVAEDIPQRFNPSDADTTPLTQQDIARLQQQESIKTGQNIFGGNEADTGAPTPEDLNNSAGNRSPATSPINSPTKQTGGALTNQTPPQAIAGSSGGPGPEALLGEFQKLAGQFQQQQQQQENTNDPGGEADPQEAEAFQLNDSQSKQLCEAFLAIPENQRQEKENFLSFNSFFNPDKCEAKASENSAT